VRSVRPDSWIARKMLRPIRPNPLMAMRTVMITPLCEMRGFATGLACGGQPPSSRRAPGRLGAPYKRAFAAATTASAVMPKWA